MISLRALAPVSVLLLSTLSATDALADASGDAAPRKLGFEVALDGGGFLGSHGGDVSDSCGSTATCHDQKMLQGTRFGGRAGLSLLEQRVGFDLDLGFWSGSSQTGRAMTMFGEQANAVPVDFTDSRSWTGTSFGLGFRYDAMTKPIVITAAATVGYMSLSVDVSRSGTITTDSGVLPISPHTTGIPTVSTSAFFLAPEVRVAVPLPANIRVGVALAAMFTSNFDVRPEKFYDAVNCGAISCRYNGKAIGFVPQPSQTPENQMEHLYLFRGSLFASIGF